MPRLNTDQLAAKVSEPLDYWMLQAHIFVTQVQDTISDVVKSMPSSDPGKKQLQEIASRSRDLISENDLADYQSLLKIMSNSSVGAEYRAQISKAIFEVPDVAGDAFKVLEALDKNPPKGENTLSKHKRLMSTYTSKSPTSSLMTNPNGGKDRMFSVSGVKYDPMGAGRIPYGYEFHDKSPGSRQIPISTGTPVLHSGGKAFGVHLVTTANIGKNASVHGSFHSYLQGFDGMKQSKVPPYKSGVTGNESYPEPNKDTPFEYVYINLQKHDADITGSGKRERIAESVRSDALYREINSYNKGACLTLPADNKFFWQGYDRHSATGNSSMGTPNSLLSQIAESIAEKKNDFIIPDKVLQRMFDSQGIEVSKSELRNTDKIKELIGSSFTKAVKDITGSDQMSGNLDSITRNAVMVQFVKGTFTDQILNATNPKRFNITCKDAIDRAGTHNLLLQINRKLNADPAQNIERSEVERYLDGLAMAYKHRPANEHRDAFISTVGKLYSNLNNTQKAKFTDNGKKWDMEKWMDANCRTKPSIQIEKPANTEVKPKGFWNTIKKVFGFSYKGTMKIGTHTYDVSCPKKSNNVTITGVDGERFNYTTVDDQAMHNSLAEFGVEVVSSTPAKAKQTSQSTIPTPATPDTPVATPITPGTPGATPVATPITPDTPVATPITPDTPVATPITPGTPGATPVATPITPGTPTATPLFEEVATPITKSAPASTSLQGKLDSVGDMFIPDALREVQKKHQEKPKDFTPEPEKTELVQEAQISIEKDKGSLKQIKSAPSIDNTTPKPKSPSADPDHHHGNHI